MSHNDWPRRSDAAAAVDGLLEAAGETFARLGVARATMTDVAHAAGCSRATLYRYFPNREALHLAFVHRATLRIAADITPGSSTQDPAALTDLILRAIAAVRADPLLAVWFEPDNVAVPIAVSQTSELLQALTAGLAQQLDVGRESTEEIALRGAWLLRCIMSFLVMPAEDDAVERAMVEAFVVPLLGPPAHQPHQSAHQSKRHLQRRRP